MDLIAYSQNQEDVLLWRALKDAGPGFYVDVGAAHPSELSVTKLFYDRGWHGLNLEPDPTYFAALQGARPRDINLPILAGATEAALPFHRVSGTGLSTLDARIAYRHRASGHTVTIEMVPCHTLAILLAQWRPEGPIHFLKIDAEGSEADILRGADFTRFRPWIVLVEAIHPETHAAGHDEWEPGLLRQGYEFAWFDGLNRFYLAAEHAAILRRHFTAPPNVFDQFLRAADLVPRLEASEAYGQNERDARQRAETHAAEERDARLQAERRLSEAQAVRDHGDVHAQRSMVAALQAIDAAVQRRTEAEHRAGILDAERSRMQAVLAQLADAADDAARRLDAMTVREADARQDADAARQVHDTARALLHQLGDRLIALEASRDAEAARRDHAERLSAAYWNSTSWWLTRPLRVVAYLLRRQVSLRDILSGHAGRRRTALHAFLLPATTKPIDPLPPAKSNAAPMTESAVPPATSALQEPDLAPNARQIRAVLRHGVGRPGVQAARHPR